MQFIYAVVVAAAGILATAILALVSNSSFLVAILFAVISWGGIVGLSVFALVLREQGEIRTLELSATLIQAFGVLSLVVGIGIALAGFVKGDIRVVDASFSEFAPLVTPVLEALVSSGLGLLAAAILVAIEEHKYEVPDGDVFGGIGGGFGGFGGGSFGGMPDLGPIKGEIEKLVTTLGAANVEASKIKPALADFGRLIEQVGVILTATSRFFDDKPGGP